MESNSIAIYYIVSFFALLFGIYWGVVVGANAISNSDSIGNSFKSTFARFKGVFSARVKKEKPEKYKEPKIRKEKRTPKKGSLLDSRVASRTSFTETQAYMENTDASSIVKQNQKNNVRQYDIMSRRKAEREQNEPEQEGAAVQESI